MNTNLKALLMIAAVAGLYLPTAAFAQKSAGSVIGEARLHPGTWNTQGSASRSRPTYRNNGPVVVRNESAPTSVAQAPSEQRSYSYEPSQQNGSSGCGCQGTVTTQQGTDTASAATGTSRSYSYEPSMSGSTSRMQSSQSSRSSRTPAYLLPKTDPNKYRTH